MVPYYFISHNNKVKRPDLLSFTGARTVFLFHLFHPIVCLKHKQTHNYQFKQRVALLGGGGGGEVNADFPNKRLKLSFLYQILWHKKTPRDRTFNVRSKQLLRLMKTVFLSFQLQFRQKYYDYHEVYSCTNVTNLPLKPRVVFIFCFKHIKYKHRTKYLSYQ